METTSSSSKPAVEFDVARHVRGAALGAPPVGQAQAPSATSSTTDIEAAQPPKSKPSFQRQSTVSKMTEKTALAKQKTMKALKKNPQKSATGVLTIVGIVVGVVLGTSLAVGVALHRRTFRYTGDARTAQVAGAAMGAAGRQSLIPVSADGPPLPPLPFPCSKPWRT